MRLRGAAAFALLISMTSAPISTAQAEAASGVDQIPQSVSRAKLAASPQQVRPPGARDQTTVNQLPSSLAERAGGRAAREFAQDDATPDAPALTLAPTHRRSGSVDADEIARILDEGNATSIDAAAAIASGVTVPSPAQAVEEERKRLPPPPGSLFYELPGGGR